MPVIIVVALLAVGGIVFAVVKVKGGGGSGGGSAGIVTGAFENPMYAMDAGGIAPFQDTAPVRGDGRNVENPMYNDSNDVEAAYQDVPGATPNSQVNDNYLEVGGDDLTGGIA